MAYKWGNLLLEWVIALDVESRLKQRRSAVEGQFFAIFTPRKIIENIWIISNNFE